MRIRILIGATLVVTASLALVASPILGRASAGGTAKHEMFGRRSQLLIDANGALTVDTNTKRAQLDQKKLAGKKVQSEDVAFLQELTNFTNDVVAASTTSQGLDAATLKLQKYPKVKEYFSQATALERSGEKLDLRATGQPNPLTVFALVGSPISEAMGMADCGIYWSPKPSVAKGWVTYKVANVDNTLRSWGYHPTPGVVGGGWTRSQTWHSWNCGWNTFRDHALKLDNTTLREQNYHGWNPRGEPNPEVYISGPWPYSTWPAYVYWWHSTR